MSDISSLRSRERGRPSRLPGETPGVPSRSSLESFLQFAFEESERDEESVAVAFAAESAARWAAASGTRNYVSGDRPASATTSKCNRVATCVAGCASSVTANF